MIISTNLGLKQWNLGSDFFNFTDLSDNLGKIDLHDHTSGKGVQIPTAGLANAAVTQAKLGASAVGTTQIQDGSVTQVKIGAGAVGSTQIASLSIGAPQLNNGSVTPAKLQGAPTFTAGQMPQWNGSGFIGASPTGVISSTAGTRPVFGIAGRLHYATDTGDLHYDTGSAWIFLHSSVVAEYGNSNTLSISSGSTEHTIGALTRVAGPSGHFSIVTQGAGNALKFLVDGYYDVRFPYSGGVTSGTPNGYEKLTLVSSAGLPQPSVVIPPTGASGVLSLRRRFAVNDTIYAVLSTSGAPVSSTILSPSVVRVAS